MYKTSHGSPQEPGRSLGGFSPLTTILALDRNEYFFEHHSDVAHALATSASEMSRYAPQGASEEVSQQIAKVAAIDASEITLGHGAEDLLTKVLCWQRLRSEHLVIADFSWQTYERIALGFQYQLHYIPVQQQAATFVVDLEYLKNFLLQANSEQTVLLTIPNNPTGATISIEDITALVKDFSQHTFLIDAVYNEPDTPFARLPSQYSNVLTFASFSKFFGLPGIRLGAVFGALPVSFRPALGFSIQTLRVAQAALQHIEVYAAHRQEMLAFANGLLPLSCERFTVFKTQAPFVLLRFRGELASDLLLAAEREAGIRPKIFERDGSTWIRVGLGSSVVNEKVRVYLDFVAQHCS